MQEDQSMPTSSSLSGSACIEFSDLLVPWPSSTLIHEDDCVGCRKVLQLPACRAVIFWDAIGWIGMSVLSAPSIHS